ncbi:hypothetical protein EV204_11535 [Tissierella praeacuta]|nr:hypothetical protein [Tissierella praeacuta]TCU66238.1 hypothetical protein EV204_11535 [Tissierella praeacuta]
MENLSAILPTILFLLPIYVGIPAIILYFVIKMAIKKAIKELKDENVL